MCRKAFLFGGLCCLSLGWSYVLVVLVGFGHVGNIDFEYYGGGVFGGRWWGDIGGTLCFSIV